MHSDPQTVVPWVTRATQIYNETCSRYGLTLNCAAPLARETGGGWSEDRPNCTLSVVRQYLHVGTLCADTGAHMPEIRKRCKSATHALPCPRVDRVRGAGSMIFSKLLGKVWNLCSTAPSRPETRFMVLALLPLFPTMPCAKRCKWDSVPALLRKSRLRCFARLARGGAVKEVSLVAYSERSRLRTMMLDDLEALWTVSPKL